MSIRSFVAINLSGEAKELIYSIEKQLKNLLHHSKIGWVKKENFHITLRFLGNIKEEDIEVLGDELKDLANSYQKFSLNICNFGVFPGLKKPRIIWVGGEYIHSLRKFYADFNKRFERIGFPEDKPFLPHITLGRIKYMSKGDIERLKNFLNDAKISYKERINKIDLVKSDLTPKGPVYTVIKSFYLK